jgi:hypothetical protein
MGGLYCCASLADIAQGSVEPSGCLGNVYGSYRWLDSEGIEGSVVTVVLTFDLSLPRRDEVGGRG